MTKLAGVVAPLRQTGLQAAGGAVALGAAAQQLAADPVELTLPFGVVGEVELLEVLDEAHQRVEGPLMDAVGFPGAPVGEQVLPQVGGLVAQGGDTIADTQGRDRERGVRKVSEGYRSHIF